MWRDISILYIIYVYKIFGGGGGGGRERPNNEHGRKLMNYVSVSCIDCIVFNIADYLMLHAETPSEI